MADPGTTSVHDRDGDDTDLEQDVYFWRMRNEQIAEDLGLYDESDDDE